MAQRLDPRLFWDLDHREIIAVFRERAEIQRVEQRTADLRAGLIASTIVNMSPHRKRGARKVQPGDWFQYGDDLDRMGHEESMRFMDRWARRQNDRTVESD